VTSRGQVLIRSGQDISIYGSDSNLVSTVPLPNTVGYLNHVVETSSGTFIISHSKKNDPLYHLSEVTINGDIIRTFVAPLGEEEYQVIDAHHIAIDDVDNIYVADYDNKRVLILNSTLRLRKTIRNTETGTRSKPWRLCYSKETRQLIIVQKEGQVDVWNISQLNKRP